MKVFFLWRYYPSYLDTFHSTRPHLGSLSYQEHWDLLLDDHFCCFADLSRYMAGQGFETQFAVGNAEMLQRKWATENDFSDYSDDDWEKAILLEQAKRCQPDIVWIASHFPYFGEFVQKIRGRCHKVITWIGEPWPKIPCLDGISVLITENPHTFESAHTRLDKVIVTSPKFDSSIAGELVNVPKKYEAVFVGQFTRVHQRRANLIAHLLGNGLPVHVFGSVDEDKLPGPLDGLQLAAWYLLRRKDVRAGVRLIRRSLFPSQRERDVESIRRVCERPVFGMDMWRTLAASQITINVHADIAGNYAGNMRMFEATLAGSCLVTEASENIADYFKPGEEVLTYSSDSELVEVVRDALAHPEETRQIAQRGQARALRDYTLAKFLDDLGPVFHVR
ncbi:MAG: glycosyltransferase family 1 protein [Rhodopirellula sp.]|nr:glycosyltransferase family 1 protein [Rhodopirellula sp.]